MASFPSSMPAGPMNTIPKTGDSTWKCAYSFFSYRADLGLLDWLSNHPILRLFTPRVLPPCELLVTFLWPGIKSRSRQKSPSWSVGEYIFHSTSSFPLLFLYLFSWLGQICDNLISPIGKLLNLCLLGLSMFFIVDAPLGEKEMLGG